MVTPVPSDTYRSASRLVHGPLTTGWYLGKPAIEGAKSPHLSLHNAANSDLSLPSSLIAASSDPCGKKLPAVIFRSGTSQLSSSSQTLVSGFLAVISVNLVIVLYIIMAMKEPGSNREHQPDPAFLAEAKASIKQPAAVTTDDNAQTREKAE
ncbi:hypothetical protein BHM03_00029022 [Ensete ventricosum]|nr:hypothetical protein BHM03_00029022 [Ensete ventricosum]